MAELKNTAWACISLDSAVCANKPPQLYVVTNTGDGGKLCAAAEHATSSQRFLDMSFPPA
jgi:hypothetical protein